MRRLAAREGAGAQYRDKRRMPAAAFETSRRVVVPSHSLLAEATARPYEPRPPDQRSGPPAGASRPRLVGTGALGRHVVIAPQALGGFARPGGRGKPRPEAEAGGRRPPGPGQRGREAPERGGAEPRACASGASASSLDTEDTSRHLRGNPHDSNEGTRSRIAEHPTRAAWLSGVEGETADHRERRARGYQVAARRRRNVARRDGFTEAYAKGRARWYLSRAKGQRERFESVRGCEERVQMLDPEIDEGTSASKLNPFERPKFVAACERAKAAGANAVVVECSDRFSRQGSKLDAWAEVELERRCGLRLLRADKPLDQHGSMVGNVTDSMHAEGAKAWTMAHASKIRSGMARKKAEGARFGRPSKPLTATELALVGKLRAEGKGWRRCALAVSEGRGAFRVADPEKRRKLTVSHSHVRRSIEGSQAVTKVVAEQKA